jgi:eukaryotic-like serine/threonine-protein kinase
VTASVRAGRPADPSDPALEIGADGRTLLQARLAVYGKILTIVNAAYWSGFLILWSREPSVGFRPALDHVVSLSSLALAALFAALWLVCRGRPRRVGLLRWLEVAAHVGYGICFGPGLILHPSPTVLTFEVLTALVFLLAVRALIVPSSWRRTAAMGVLTCAPIVASVAYYGRALTPPAIMPGTLLGIYVNWCLVAVAFSAAASRVLYGLRRQVRDAQRMGQYTLLEPLGHGGMGVVYRARHAMLRRPTAVKLLTVAETPQTLDRFEREVQQMAMLAHPNIVTVYDYGRTETGGLYYAMELLDGADLERVIQVDGPQPAARVVHLLLQACRALAGAHAAGLVHRDIKPGNLFLCRDWGSADAVKVLDFGLVKETQTGGLAVTADGALLGTPLYMAPETWIRPRDVDVRSDLYALGAVAYFMLTGRPVFEGTNPFEVMTHHVQSPPAPPSAFARAPVPADLEAIVLRCLAKDPDERFASAELLRAHLEDCALAGVWTAADARAWWSEHEAALRRPRPAPDPLDRTELHVDWNAARRAAHDRP